MKRLAKYIFTCIMTTIFLISGNGVVLAIHTCMATSDKKVSLFNETACCSEEEKPCKNDDQCNSFHSECCTSEYQYYKVSLPFLQNKTDDISLPEIVLPEALTLNFSGFRSPVKPILISADLSSDLPFLYQQLLI